MFIRLIKWPNVDIKYFDLFVATIIVFSVNSARATVLDESFNCEGTLIVNRNFKKESEPINNGEVPFRFDRKNTLSISVFVPNEKKPSVKVFPWNGIDFKKLAPLKEQANTKVSVTGEKYFSVEILKFKKTYHLSCAYFE